MAPGVLHRVIHGTSRPDEWQKQFITVRPALVESYRRHRVLGCHYPAITPCKGATVRGSLVTGLTQMDVYRLDIFEGSQYDRKSVMVKVLKRVGLDEKVEDGNNENEKKEDEEEEESVEADTYIWKEARSELEDKEWDFEEFKKEKMMYWMGDYGGSNMDEYEDDSENGEINIDVDEGFADVDRAVAAEKANGAVKDPMGGRGSNGAITKQLQNSGV